MLSSRSDGLHVAIIMDGNGRWAERRGLLRAAGHRAGIASVRRIVEHALESGIRCLTLYAFSSDNWRRPSAEVQSIFWLLRAFLRLETARLRARGVQLSFIGRRDRLAPAVLSAVESAENATAAGDAMLARIALDYSSRQAIANAATRLPVCNSASSETLHATMSEVLYADAGEVDLLIRTGGEQRLSDFLLWESAYAELYFTDRMWPEFDGADLDAALADFHKRQRRFGGLTAPQAAHSDGSIAGQL